MDQRIIDTVLACTRDSDAEVATFPAILASLAATGVERYHADLCRAEKTYFLPDGASHVTPCHAVEAPFASAFSATAVAEAVRGAQAGRVRYREFCRLMAAAGCVGYLVSLPGRRVVYYGRTGEVQVEHFPAKA